MKKILASVLCAWTAPAWSAMCSQAQIDEILSTATEQNHSVEVRCSATLPPNSRISKQLYFSGNQASHITFNCQNSTIAPTHIKSGDSIMIRSLLEKGKWSRPENVALENCRVQGSVRILGMGMNGEATLVRESSQQEGHTQRAQNAAPTKIQLNQLTIIGQSRIPLYLAPGVSYVNVTNSRIIGKSNSVAIYLDAESGHNSFTHNVIDTQTTKRELIAIDGSAHNSFSQNRFSALNHGGIYLYRNCGEGGTIRHQTPSYNHISNNVFFYRKYKGKLPAVWLGARNGNRNYCHADDGYSFGSSRDNRDFADNNVIENNQIYKLSPRKMLRDHGSGNRIVNNQTVY